MEKTITFDRQEMMQMAQIEQERLQIMAQIGALMMDLENAKKQLENINERNKSHVRQILIQHGVDKVESVRPIKGGLVATVPDEKQMSLLEELDASKNN